MKSIMVQCNINTTKEKMYRKKIKILQQQLKRRNKKIKSLKGNFNYLYIF